MLTDITVLILSYNEEPNLSRTIASLKRFHEVVVLDSGSTDRTTEILDEFSNTRLVTRMFDNHADQWNYGVQQCSVSRSWILALDADYVLSDELVTEISNLDASDKVVAYEASFRYCVHGKRLSGTLYPPKVVLFRHTNAQFVQEGHTQRILVDGSIGFLNAKIDHDDRKSLGRWLTSQLRYASLEADYLISKPRTSLRLVERIRLTCVFGPFFAVFYALLVKRCFLDGWAGWFYVLQRLTAEVLIAAELVDRKLGSRKSERPFL